VGSFVAVLTTKHGFLVSKVKTNVIPKEEKLGCVSFFEFDLDNEGHGITNSASMSDQKGERRLNQCGRLCFVSDWFHCHFTSKG